MGYACPVCETPQRDGEHLAHHLAFTAMLHGDDHESWLDERVPDWSDRDPDGLAAEVTPHAEDAEYHEVFEDTVDRGHPDVDLGEHDHAGHGHGTPGAAGGSGAVDATGEVSSEVADAIREAREMVREAEDGADDPGNDGDAAADPGNDSDAAADAAADDSDDPSA